LEAILQQAAKERLQLEQRLAASEVSIRHCCCCESWNLHIL